MRKLIINSFFLFFPLLLEAQNIIESGVLSEDYEKTEITRETNTYEFKWDANKKKGIIVCHVFDSGNIKEILKWDILEYFLTSTSMGYVVVGSKNDRMLIVFEKDYNSVTIINLRTNEYVVVSGETVKY